MRGPKPYTTHMNLREAAWRGLMSAIRYAPVPWKLKQTGINLATPRMIVVATALIPDGVGRWLMLRARYSGHWIPPGGVVNPGEDPLAGVRRECREELGHEVQVERFTGLYAHARTSLLFADFLCAPLTGPPRLSHEHEDWRYEPLDHLPWRVRFSVESALRGDTTPVIQTLRRPQQ
jgi:8-oxo-dGTP diphosphatase